VLFAFFFAFRFEEGAVAVLTFEAEGFCCGAAPGTVCGTFFFLGFFFFPFGVWA
jgi:hypothetical protein